MEAKSKLYVAAAGISTAIGVSIVGVIQTFPGWKAVGWGVALVGGLYGVYVSRIGRIRRGVR